MTHIFRIHGVVVSHNKQHVFDYINEALEEVGLAKETDCGKILDVVDGHIGEGYGLSTQEELGEHFMFFEDILD